MITVLGAAGQLGHQFRNLIAEGRFLTRNEIDLAEPGFTSILEPLISGPVINCAAWTAVDSAETSETRARLVNAGAVAALARLCATVDVPFVTYSTDYVFDGRKDTPYREDDPTGPINAYGRTKLEGELRALEYPGALVIRTSWVQSGTHPCFVTKILQRAVEHGEVKVVDDQIGRPTFAPDLARSTLEALDIGLTGLFHVANHGATTWYGLAREAVLRSALDARVIPVSSAEFPTAATRPHYSVLDTGKADAAGLTPLPHWTASLDDALAASKAGGKQG